MAKVPKVALEFDQLNAYGVKLLCGIVRYSRDNGPWIFYRDAATGLNPELTPARTRKHLAWLINEWRADGFVLIAADSEGYPEGTDVNVYLYD